jgi:hypothetical protein
MGRYPAGTGCPGRPLAARRGIGGGNPRRNSRAMRSFPAAVTSAVPRTRQAALLAPPYGRRWGRCHWVRSPPLPRCCTARKAGRYAAADTPTRLTRRSAHRSSEPGNLNGRTGGWRFVAPASAAGRQRASRGKAEALPPAPPWPRRQSIFWKRRALFRPLCSLRSRYHSRTRFVLKIYRIDIPGHMTGQCRISRLPMSWQARDPTEHSRPEGAERRYRRHTRGNVYSSREYYRCDRKKRKVTLGGAVLEFPTTSCCRRPDTPG